GKVSSSRAKQIAKHVANLGRQCREFADRHFLQVSSRFDFGKQLVHNSFSDSFLTHIGPALPGAHPARRTPPPLFGPRRPDRSHAADLHLRPADRDTSTFRLPSPCESSSPSWSHHPPNPRGRRRFETPGPNNRHN